MAARTVEVVNRLREMSPLYEMAKEGVDLKSIHVEGGITTPTGDPRRTCGHGLQR